MEYLILAIVAYVLLVALKVGAKRLQPVKKPHKTNGIPVNVNGHRVRTITIKAHTRTVGA